MRPVDRPIPRTSSAGKDSADGGKGPMEDGTLELRRLGPKGKTMEGWTFLVDARETVHLPWPRNRIIADVHHIKEHRHWKVPAHMRANTHMHLYARSQRHARRHTCTHNNLSIHMYPYLIMHVYTLLWDRACVHAYSHTSADMNLNIISSIHFNSPNSCILGGWSLWNELPLVLRLLPRVHSDAFYSCLKTAPFKRTRVESASV